MTERLKRDEVIALRGGLTGSLYEVMTPTKSKGTRRQIFRKGANATRNLSPNIIDGLIAQGWLEKRSDGCYWTSDAGKVKLDEDNNMSPVLQGKISRS